MYACMVLVCTMYVWMDVCTMDYGCMELWCMLYLDGRILRPNVKITIILVLRVLRHNYNLCYYFCVTSIYHL